MEQNPDSPGERERIEAMGGFVSDPEEPGASARVWLNESRTLVGLAMARSIGDLAVKRVSSWLFPVHGIFCCSFFFALMSASKCWG